MLHSWMLQELEKRPKELESTPRPDGNLIRHGRVRSERIFGDR